MLSLNACSEDLTISGHSAFILLPDNPAAGNPWVWYAPTLTPSLPAAEESWMFERFLAAGITIAGIDVGESYGSLYGRELFTDYYNELVTNRDMSKTPCFLARSRGGLMAINWAVEHPDCVSGIAGIYPVSNLASFPGLTVACTAYNMTEQELAASFSVNNPIDRLAPLATANVPIYFLHGDEDTMVPLKDNSASLAQRYDKLGGNITMDVKIGHGHDCWVGWFQDEGLTNFVINSVTIDCGLEQGFIKEVSQRR